MTLCVVAVVHGGIVLAADSRTVRTNGRVLSDHTRKLLEVGRCGVVTSGFATLRGRHISHHVDEWILSGQAIPDEPGALAAAMKERFDRLCQQHDQESVQKLEDGGLVFMVAGYEQGGPAVYELRVPNGVVTHENPSGGHIIAWIGQTDVVQRLILGIDPRFDRSTLSDAQRKVVEGLSYRIPTHVLNAQDGIDFALFLIRTTMDMQRFADGVFLGEGEHPTVGGEINVALVTASQGFYWVQRKSVRGERRAHWAER